MLTHKNVCLHALGTIAELKLTDSDTWGHIAPMFHLADAWATFAITWVGARHVMVAQFEAEAVMATIEKVGRLAGQFDRAVIAITSCRRSSSSNTLFRCTTS